MDPEEEEHGREETATDGRIDLRGLPAEALGRRRGTEGRGHGLPGDRLGWIRDGPTPTRGEAGASAQMPSIIRIFRVLDLLQNLDQMIPEAGPGPMELLQRKSKTRQRASRSRKPDAAGKPWTWDAET